MKFLLPQDATCKMLEESTACGAVWTKCHRAAEVQSMKDNYVAARMHQLKGSAAVDGVDFHKCAVVKEYIESGRANAKANEADPCTNSEVNGLYCYCSREQSDPFQRESLDKRPNYCSYLV